MDLRDATGLLDACCLDYAHNLLLLPAFRDGLRVSENGLVRDLLGATSRPRVSTATLARFIARAAPRPISAPAEPLASNLATLRGLFRLDAAGVRGGRSR